MHRACLILTLAPFVCVLGCRNLYDKQVETQTQKRLVDPFAQVSPAEMAFENETRAQGGGTVRSLFCDRDSQGNYPSSLTMNDGDGEDYEAGDYVFGEGGGCVARSLRDVWATSMNQSLMIWNDDHNNNSATWDTVDPPEGIAKYFAVHYAHKEAMPLKTFVIHWDMNWIHQVRLGTEKDPVRVMINFHKYQGEKHMEYWQGTIILDRVSDGLTGVYIRNQLRMARTNGDDAKSGASDILEKFKSGAPAYDSLP